MREALLYETLPDNMVRCRLCRHYCTIAPGRRGRCHVRENRDGTLVSLVYGRVIAEQIDPVEKKPLFHFLPGSRTYSIATVGCNFTCDHCQNHTIAQYQPHSGCEAPGDPVEPAEIVRRALLAGCRSISFTYTEPTVFFEYALDVARMARGAGLKTVFVTNGYMTTEALDMIAPYLDAANIDLKGFTDDFYHRVAGARLDQVLACLCDYRRRGIWMELTTLVIPGENDNPEQLADLASFIAGKLGVDVPWHVSRFFPHHRMNDRAPTAVPSLDVAVTAGRSAGLRFVYTGNTGKGVEDTTCPSCGALLVERQGFLVVKTGVAGGCCSGCGLPVAGVWQIDAPATFESGC